MADEKQPSTLPPMRWPDFYPNGVMKPVDEHGRTIDVPGGGEALLKLALTGLEDEPRRENVMSEVKNISVKPGVVRVATVAELAQIAFDANEYLQALEMMNTPEEYEERKKAFIELAEARFRAAEARRALEAAING